jgi:hypothetical protein
MVLRAAREIKEGETVFVGTRLPLLAYLVAKATHAPSAVALYENGLIREEAARELLFTMGDPPNILDATMAGTTLDVMGLMAAGRIDLGFMGAAEVDRYGNLNSTEGVDAEGRTTRLPGSGGAVTFVSPADRSCSSRTAAPGGTRDFARRRAAARGRDGANVRACHRAARRRSSPRTRFFASTACSRRRILARCFRASPWTTCSWECRGSRGSPSRSG